MCWERCRISQSCILNIFITKIIKFCLSLPFYRKDKHFSYIVIKNLIINSRDLAQCFFISNFITKLSTFTPKNKKVSRNSIPSRRKVIRCSRHTNLNSKNENYYQILKILKCYCEEKLLHSVIGKSNGTVNLYLFNVYCTVT